MGRKSKAGGRGQNNQMTSSNQNHGGKGIPRTEDSKKQRNLNVITGIIPLEMERLTVTTPVVTSERTQIEIIQGNGASRRSWADKVGEEAIVNETQTQEQRSWSRIVATVPLDEGEDLKRESPKNSNVKITAEDIHEEVEFWKTGVVCYVLGSNPPQSVMEGYFNRIWGKLGIDLVAQVQRGVFLVRFHTAESRMKVVEEGVQMFDRKPVIVKPWQHDIELKKEIMDNIQVWIRLPGLNVKYWGKTSVG